MASVYIKAGTGSGSGTRAAPYFYSELSTAETAAGSNGTILFTDQGGDYSLTGTNTWDGIGSSGNNITYKSEEPQKAVIKSSAGGTLRVLNVGAAGNTSLINVLNFKFIDILTTLANSGAGEMSGNELTCSTNIAFGGTGTFTEVANGSTGGYKFKNNSLHIQYASGTYLMKYTKFLQEFSGNTFFVSNVGTGTIYLEYNGAAQDVSNVPVYKNNIFATDNASTGLDTQATIADQGSNNCFFQFDDTYNASGGTDNVFADPQFVDSANGDLRLRPSSPCINAGVA